MEPIAGAGAAWARTRSEHAMLASAAKAIKQRTRGMQTKSDRERAHCMDALVYYLLCWNMCDVFLLAQPTDRTMVTSASAEPGDKTPKPAEKAKLVCQ